MTSGGGGVRQKGILYDKWGLRVRQKVLFQAKRVASLFLYHFKSYLELMWSLFNWFSNKYERTMVKKATLSKCSKGFFMTRRGGG